MTSRAYPPLVLALVALAVAAYSPAASAPPAPPSVRPQLIAATATVATVGEFPWNPLKDPSLDDSKLSKDIIWGFKIFVDTPGQVPHLTPGKVSCNNCHLNGGQRERALPVVGIAGMFPEYNRRAGRTYTLTDRVVDCFNRSQNATSIVGGENGPAVPTPTSKEVLAVTAYLTWLSKGFEVGKNPPWRGQNAIAAANLIPLEKLSPARGEALFKQHCVSCHGDDGQGVLVGEKKPGPLWGADSWNDGAGAARIYTLAGIIRYSMPYVTPGVLTDEESQHLAAFINSHPRPSYPFKDRDFLIEKLPVDSVYYPKR